MYTGVYATFEYMSLEFPSSLKDLCFKPKDDKPYVLTEAFFYKAICDLNTVGNSEEENAALLSAKRVLSWSCQRADSDVDSYLFKKYQTPLPAPVPAMISGISCDIAYYYLHGGGSGAVAEDVLKRYEKALKRLKEIANSDINLLPVTEKQLDNSSRIFVCGKPKRLTQNVMDKFHGRSPATFYDQPNCQAKSSCNTMPNTVTSAPTAPTPTEPTAPTETTNQGGVFITNIEPQGSGNVGSKVFSSQGKTLETCQSDTRLIRVTVDAMSGVNYVPVVEVNGETVTMSGTDSPLLYRGVIDLEIPASLQTFDIKAVKSNGGEDVATVTMKSKPKILNAYFTGEYPVGQTELKEGDTFLLKVIASEPVEMVQVFNAEALKAVTHTASEDTVHTFTVTVADKGNTLQQLGAVLNVTDSTGSSSDMYNTAEHGGDNGIHVLNVNNLHPSIDFINTEYPTGQQALKDSEQATVFHSVINADTATAFSSNSELLIESPTPSQLAVTRNGGGYNIDTPNLTMKATRTANSAVTTRSTVVNIAHTLPELSVSLPFSRLASGGNMGTSVPSYTVQLNSTQRLLNASIDVVEDAGELIGNWQGQNNNTRFINTINVHDDNLKGIFDWQEISAVNLAGREVTTINSSGSTYTLGGFLRRSLQIAAWTNRQTDLGVKVYDTSRLRCSNLSEGESGSYNYSYQSTTDDTNNKYTILNDSVFYNCDLNNSVSNTTGLLTVEIEEL